MISLFDCVATLAEVMGQRLRQPEIVNILIPLLNTKWTGLDDMDKKLLPLFECFENVIHAIGEEFIQPYVVQIFERCTRILKSILQTVRAEPKEGWVLTEAFFLRATELISVILLTMGTEKSSELIHHENNLLLSLMVEFLGENNLMARQTVLGLFGDSQERIVDPRQVFLAELIRHASLNL